MNTLRSRIGSRILATLLAALALTIATQVYAATTAPQKLVYNGRLLNSTGVPITTAHSMRFSFWSSADEVPTDVTGTGAINTGASNYVSWNEVQTVTPDSNGYFSVSLGSGTALPSIDSLPTNVLLNLFLQVEVKAAAAADTAYEILDPKPLDPATDRTPPLPVPFALNADRLDQHDVGTGSGAIPLVGSGGLLPVSIVPGGTDSDTFTLDSNDDATSFITLKFGETLGKALAFDIVNNRFNFNADVRIGGNLTVTGFVNGVDLTSLVSSGFSPLRTTSGGGLRVNIAAGGYRINGTITDFTGSSSVLPNNADSYLYFTATGYFIRSSGFPTNVSFIPVSKVTTAGGLVAQIEDKRVMNNDNRENSIVNILHPEFKDAAYLGDGAENVGQLSVSHDDTTKNNFYVWTTTRASLQDYDVIIRATLPQHFVRWKTNPVTLHYRTGTGNAADNKLDVSVFDTAGTAVSISNGGALASTSWTTAGITFSGTPTWTAGQTFVVKIKVSARNSAQATIGDLELRYVEMEKE